VTKETIRDFKTAFSKIYFQFPKLDKNKCPKTKTKNTFWKFLFFRNYLYLKKYKLDAIPQIPISFKHYFMLI
jgi:hypothetical protein